jgi:TonB family protein
VTEDVDAPAPRDRFGRYEIQSELGEGAMGRVYRAFDPLVQRVVAIKTVKPEVLTTDTAHEYLRRFRREAQAVGPLSHPNIVSVYDVGEDYFVMEFVEGLSLQSLLAQRARLPLAEALRILGPVAEAIDYAHRFEIIHRDIKPANIMIQPDGRPKLMDFGVARLPTSVVTGSGPLFGSPSYMAPEQITSDKLTPLTPAADLFALSVVAYEALTGRRPFQGESVAAIVYQIVHAPAPAPRSLNEDLPPHHDDVFHRALAKHPHDRYPSAVSFVAALAAEGMMLPESLLEPFPVTSASIAIPTQLVSTPVPAGEMETHAFARGADGRLALDTSAVSRRWLPWAAGLAAMLAVTAEIVALSWTRPIPARVSPRVPSEGLRIETRPPGASVWIDGRAAGAAPLSIQDLRPGLHQVRVSQEGFAPAELTFAIPDGISPPPLRFVMAPLHSALAEAPAGEKVVVRARLRPAPANPPPTPAPTPKRVVEGDLVDLDDSVKPPRLVVGEHAAYPKAARRLHLQGTVEVEIIVDDKGVPRDPRIVQSAGAALDEAVIAAVYKFRYEPATRQGVRVAVRQTYRQTLSP